MALFDRYKFNPHKFLHAGCDLVFGVRFLLDKEHKYVFDVLYRNTIILSDGNSYNNLEDCFSAAQNFMQNVFCHLPQDAKIC